MKTGLVLEGGALRGIFTSGVVDCFLLENFYFDYAVGVSAGSGNITSLKSRQIGRTANVIAAPKESKYIGFAQMIHSRQYLNLDMMFMGADWNFVFECGMQNLTLLNKYLRGD